MNADSVQSLWDMQTFACSTEYFPLTVPLSPREREQQASDRCLIDGRWANSGVGVMGRQRTSLPLPKGEYLFTVAQIFNLPYRRFVIGRASVTPKTLDFADAPQVTNVTNLRYSRPQVCATSVGNTVNRYKGEGRGEGEPSVAYPMVQSVDREPIRSATPRAAAFTLVELLTVIAVIAVLASLLMTAVASAKKKSRTAVCMVNLHQISLALDMYLDDFGKRPPSVDDLVGGKYLHAPRSLLCPEDKTGNWGRLVQSGNFMEPYLMNPTNGAQFGGPPATSSEPVRYSYLMHPLSWDDATWDRLMEAGGSAGVAACQLHGLGTQEVPDVHSFSGLLLRVQRDGAVVRRRLFWTTDFLRSSTAGTFTISFGAPGSVPDLYPMQIYLDDPTRWFQTSP